MAIITAEAELAHLRTSGRILATAMAAVAQAVKPGVTTAELDRIAREAIEAQGGQPAFLGFEGYPASLCTSINSAVVHGIPSPDRQLRIGDIIGLDLGVIYHGMYTDHAITLPVGPVSPAAQRLMQETKTSLQRGLAVVRAGARVGDISAAIEGYLKPQGYGIIRQLTGHGVGRAVHEAPSIPNFGRAGTGPELVEGMVLAIEPMVSLGDWQIKTLEDGWTVVTADDSLAAHFEETIRVTVDGFELITAADGKNPSA